MVSSGAASRSSKDEVNLNLSISFIVDLTIKVWFHFRLLISHFGGNSATEAIWFGVPLSGMAMQSDGVI